MVKKEKLFIILALGFYSLSSSAMDKAKSNDEDLKQCKESLEAILHKLDLEEIREEARAEAALYKIRAKEDQLFVAFRDGNFEKFNALLKEGVNAESLIKHSMHYWTRWKQGGGDYVEQLKILLRLGADPTKKEYGVSPLSEALSCLNVEATKLLLADSRVKIEDYQIKNARKLMHDAMHTDSEYSRRTEKMFLLLIFLERYELNRFSPKEVQEFGPIKVARMGATHTAIMQRQITGKFGAKPKPHCAKKETATASSAATAPAHKANL